MTEWPPARVGTLIQLWSDGNTADRIAELLGTTRSAVLGKIRRLRLDLDRRPIR